MKKILITLSLLLVISSFCSCDNILNFNKNQEAKVEEKKEEVATPSEVDTGDKLLEYVDETYTLSKYHLPKKGDVISGFKVNGIYDFSDRDAKVVMFEHEKTGAKAVLISNDDEDKCFSLGFNTFAYDDKGIPHVFEHSSLAGTEKYKSESLFFELYNKTYNTFVNAATAQSTTYYPCSSLSDEQLFALYKVYLDGVLKPSILDDEMFLRQEGFRYTLDDKNSDIDVKGVVYSEMSGYASDISILADYNGKKTLYPGSYASSVTGGIPKEILTIKHDEIKEFHDKYYSPSNMMFLLYGDLDYEKYLTYADTEYLKNYNKTTVDKEDKNYKKNDGFVSKNYDFPALEDADIDKGSVYTYLVDVTGISEYELGNMSLVFATLTDENGPIKSRLLEKLPDASFSAYLVPGGNKYYISIKYTNVGESDGETLKSITEEALNDIATEGISKDIADSIVDRIELKNELNNDTHGFVDELDDFYEMSFASFDGLGYFKYMKGQDDVGKRYQDGSVDAIAKKYFSSNEHSAFCGTIPRAGLEEKNDAEFEKALKDKKASMSDAEINELISDTKAYDEWLDSRKGQSIIKEIRVASVSSLPEYKPNCYAYEEHVDGISYIRSDIDDINYNQVSMYFDTSFVKPEDTLKLSLLSDLMLNLPTENYSELELNSALSKVASNYGAYATDIKYFNDGHKPYFVFTEMSLDKNLDKTFELIEELMKRTKFDDVDKVRACVANSYYSLKQSANNNPIGFSQNKVIYVARKDYAYEEHVRGTDYMLFLKDVMDMSDDEIKSLLSDCKNILENSYNKNGMVCTIISNFKTMKTIKAKVQSLMSDFKDEKIVPANYDEFYDKDTKSVAYVKAGDVNCNVIGTRIATDSSLQTGKLQVLQRIVNDKILIPEFRIKRAAYGAVSSLGRANGLVYSYDDPGLAESYKIFSTLPETINDLSVTDDELEDYKMNAYSYFSYPLTKYEASTTAIDEIMSKCNDTRSNRYVRFMQEIKAMKCEEIKELSNVFQKIIDDGYKVTVGNKEQIETNKDLFDKIIYDYQ